MAGDETTAGGVGTGTRLREGVMHSEVRREAAEQGEPATLTRRATTREGARGDPAAEATDAATRGSGAEEDGCIHSTMKAVNVVGQQSHSLFLPVLFARASPLSPGR